MNKRMRYPFLWALASAIVCGAAFGAPEDLYVAENGMEFGIQFKPLLKESEAILPAVFLRLLDWRSIDQAISMWRTAEPRKLPKSRQLAKGALCFRFPRAGGNRL